MRESMFIPCVREVQASIKYSVKKLLDDTIEHFGWQWFYTSKLTEIVGLNGTKFVFFGMQDFNADNVKSLEGADACWVAEAQSMSRRSVNVLRPTIRKDGSTLWWDFNPRYDTDPVYVDYIINEDPNAEVLWLSHEDNPWFTAALRLEMESDYARDPEEAAHVWEGKLANLKDAIIRNWDEVDEVPEGVQLLGYGLDFGYANDPACLMKIWEHRRDLYVQQLIYKLGLTNQDLAEEFRTLGIGPEDIIRADSAEPKSIRELRNEGFLVLPSDKGNDYKRAAAKWLRSRTIHIIRGSTDAKREIPRWKWARDKFGNLLPRPADGDDHTVDAVIYGAYRKPKRILS
jgi:phage terminase large subunit